MLMRPLPALPCALASLLIVALFSNDWKAARAQQTQTSAEESVEGPSAAVDGEQTIAAMRAALRQWLQDVEFVCTYRWTSGRASSIEAALARKWGIEFQEAAIEGVFNKGLGKVRVSADYSAEPVIVSQTAETAEVANLDFDEVANSEVALRYMPRLNPDKQRGEALFTPRDLPFDKGRRVLGPFDAGWHSRGRLSPLYFSGPEIGAELDVPDAASNIVQTVVRNDQQAIVIRLQYKERGYQHDRRVTFSLAWGTPVIESVELTMVGPAGDRWQSKTQGFRFVQTPGGPVASIVRNAITNRDPRHPELPFAVYEWRSDDLGQRTPTHADFLVPIHQQTDIYGVAKTSNPLTDGKLDVDKVDLAAVTTRWAEGGVGPVPRDAAAAPRASRWGYVIVIVNVVALAAIIAFYRWRRALRGK